MIWWRLLSRALKVIAGLVFAALAATELYLIHTWRFNRPYAPDPADGWTVTLPWCLGAYGTPRERDFLISCLWWAGAALALVVLGVGIDHFRPGESRMKPEG